MTEQSNPPRADVPVQPSLNGGHDGAAESHGQHTRVGDIRTGVEAATEKTREAVGRAVGGVEAATEKTRDVVERAVGAAREQVEQHPGVVTAVERAAETSGKTAKAAGQQARRHPRIVGGMVAGGAALLAVRQAVRSRRRAGG